MSQKLKRIRQFMAAVILSAAFVGISSCDKYSYPPPVVDEEQTWSLQTDIQPIFNDKCIECHKGNRPPDLREGKSHTSLTEGGYVELPGETSELYLKITSGDHIPRSTDTEKQMILFWINQGALNN